VSPIIHFGLWAGLTITNTTQKTIMVNDLSTNKAAGRNSNNNNALDLGEHGGGRWYMTDHFRERMQERHIRRSSISRDIRSGRSEDGRKGTVKRTGDQVVVILKGRSLITVYPVGEPEPEPVAGWGSLVGVLGAMGGLIGGVLLVANGGVLLVANVGVLLVAAAMCKAQRTREERRRRDN
jgi:hypothetical protein